MNAQPLNVSVISEGHMTGLEGGEYLRLVLYIIFSAFRRYHPVLFCNSHLHFLSECKHDGFATAWRVYTIAGTTSTLYLRPAILTVTSAGSPNPIRDVLMPATKCCLASKFT